MKFSKPRPDSLRPVWPPQILISFKCVSKSGLSKFPAILRQFEKVGKSTIVIGQPLNSARWFNVARAYTLEFLRIHLLIVSCEEAFNIG